MLGDIKLWKRETEGQRTGKDQCITVIFGTTTSSCLWYAYTCILAD